MQGSSSGRRGPNNGRLGHQPRVRAAPATAEPDRVRRRARNSGSSVRVRFGQGNGFIRVRAIFFFDIVIRSLLIR
jgi:hypothetical protein